MSQSRNPRRAKSQSRQGESCQRGGERRRADEPPQQRPDPRIRRLPPLATEVLAEQIVQDGEQSGGKVFHIGQFPRRWRAGGILENSPATRRGEEGRLMTNRRLRQRPLKPVHAFLGHPRSRGKRTLRECHLLQADQAGVRDRSPGKVQQLQPR